MRVFLFKLSYLEEKEKKMAEAALKRSKDKMIAGVCGGIAERFVWSPNIVRLIYVLVSICSAAFPGILVYLVLWFVIPGPQD